MMLPIYNLVSNTCKIISNRSIYKQLASFIQYFFGNPFFNQLQMFFYLDLSLLWSNFSILLVELDFFV